MGLQNLCDELLLLIFARFCFHCEHPDHFPNADVLNVRINKRTLAYLCHTCKQLCRVAQPILYHYYATGNLYKEIKIFEAPENRSRTEFPPWEPDYFPQFLRTVSRYPSLASQVKTAQLVFNLEDPVHSSQVDTMKSVLKDATAKGLATWREPHWGEDHISSHELTIFALQCLPYLHTLLISEGDPAWYNNLLGYFKFDVLPKFQFPSLRVLAVIRQRQRDYHITQLGDLYRSATNLDTLYAFDSAGWASHAYHSNYDDGPVDGEISGISHIRRVVVEGLTPRNMCGLTCGLDSVEDLEFYWDDFRMETFSLDDMLGNVRTTLKRLCLSYLSGRWDEWYRYIFPDVENPTIGSLADFILEDVSLDCHSIYLESDPDVLDRLSKLLPKTIRRFRISYLYRGIPNGLSGLAVRAPRELPLLKEVVIGEAGSTADVAHLDVERAKEIPATKDTGPLFKAAGIRFLWKQDLIGADARTRMPGGMAGSRLIPIPSVMDDME